MTKGSRIEAVAHYDNSTNNTSNPDPKVAVHWGEQTWQEMQYTGLTYTVDEKGADATAAGQKYPPGRVTISLGVENSVWCSAD